MTGTSHEPRNPSAEESSAGTSAQKPWPVRFALSAAALFGYGLLLTALMSAAFVALGIPPQKALPMIWVGAFGDSASGHVYAISETIIKTTPLLLTGLSIVVAWRAGLFSIGGEGQLVVGVLAAISLLKLHAHVPAPLLTLLMVAAGTGAGALWGGIAGWLRVRRNVQEVISTIMLNYIAVYLLTWSMEGPLQEAAHHNRQSDPIPDAVLFARILPASLSNGLPTRLHTGVLLAAIAAVLISLLLFRTSLGFGLRAVGQNAEAARAARFPVERLRMQAMLISGGLCGLAGVIELLGITGRLYADFSPGWGYTAIPVALLGGLNPYGVVLSALFFGALTTGSSNLERFSGVSSVLIYVIQAAAVLTVVGVRAWRARRQVNPEE